MDGRHVQDYNYKESSHLMGDNQLEMKQEKKTSSFQAIITYIIAFLGIGILTLPYGFKMGGLVIGLVIMLILALCSSYAYKLLVWCKKEIHQQGYVHVNTYTEIGEFAMGRAGVYLSNIGLIMNQLGVAAAFVVFIGDNLRSLVNDKLSLNECVGISVPLLIVLSLIRDIKFLSKTSMIALTSLAVAIVVIFWTGLSNKPPIHKINIWPSDFFLFFGIAVMAYSGISVSLPIEESMEKPEQYDNVLHITLVFLTVLYCGFGLLTYAFFGNNVSDVITTNLRSDWEAMLAKIGLILLLLFGIPVQLYSVYQIVENSLEPKLLRFNRVTRILITSSIRIVILLGTVGLAIVVPLFGLFTNLIGSLCTTAITYVFPPLFHLLIFRRANKLHYKYIIISFIIMAIGIGGGGASSVVTLKKIIQKLSHHNSTLLYSDKSFF